MTTLARCNFAVQDDDGTIVDGASITVTRETSGALAIPYSDKTGLTPLGNPYVAADGANAGFYVIGGFYRIDAVKDGLTRTLRDVGIGTGAGTDVPISGDVVTYTDTDVSGGAITIAATVGRAFFNVTSGININIGLAAARDGLDLLIKDISGSASTHNLTPVFSGGELADGFAGSALKIQTDYGWLALTPKTGGFNVLAAQL